MPLFRKKPVVIEAIQFSGIFDTGFMGLHGPMFIGKMPEWLKQSQTEEGASHLEEGQWTFLTETGTLFIKTLEGIMTASAGDYIIQGVNGEIYPCKPDIFELTYEEVI